ncbi:MAG: carbohydrate-binding domain-containing protein [Flavobacteriaceae bacterium]
MLALLLLMFSFMNCSSDNDSEETAEETEETDDTDDDTTDTGTISITDGASSGTAEGDTSNDAADEDDILANSTFDTTVSIVYSGTSATVTNPLDGNGVTVTQDNGDITVEATVAGVQYNLSGTTTDGSFKIYSEKKFLINLNGVSITNSDGPAINNQSGKRTFVVLSDTNSLTDGATYSNIPDDEDAKAAFFSEGQLIFSGSGTLNVKGNYKHGIASDDYVRVINGTINVTAAPSDGIHTNDAFIADGGTISLYVESDAIEVEEGYIVINNGTFEINAGDDGIAASYETDTTIDPYVTINGGDFVIVAAGEGIESKTTLTINDGSFEIEAVDDGLNAGSAIYFNGGSLYVNSSTNDAIDSNGTLTITGGTIVAIGAAAPEASFDNDNNTFKITGGNLVGIGGSASTPTSSATTQHTVVAGNYGSANSILHIQAADGTEALTFLVPKSYSTMVFSNGKMEGSTTYKIFKGGSVSGGEDFHGLYTSGTYTAGTQQSTTFTTNSTVTQVGVTGGR